MLRLHIAKVNEVLFSGEVEGVTAPASEGEVTILPNHISYVTPLAAGRIRIHKEGSNDHAHYDIEGGLLEVSPAQATILL